MELRPTDLHFVVARIPKDIQTLLRDTPLFLAGGFIRATIAGERPNDLDLFGGDKEGLHLTALGFTLNRRGRLHTTPNAFTVLTPSRMPVQFITRWLYTDPIQLLGEFDFTVAQAVVWHRDGKWHSLVGDDFYADLAARRLVYTSPRRAEDAGGSILRVRKFLTAGYTIQAGSLAGVIARLCQGVDQIRNLAIEEDYLKRLLTALLREVDPLTVVDGIDLVDEHDAITQED